MDQSSFHHVILFRLREGVPLDRVRSAREALAELVETLPGVLYLTVTHNVAEHNGGYTMALFAGFENKGAFEICTRHPEWKRVFQEHIEPVVEARIVAEGAAR
ncbi:MAG: Dabb family protein [Planctomycetota bacterium]